MLIVKKLATKTHKVRFSFTSLILLSTTPEKRCNT